MEAVLGHELTHIRNGDVQLMVVAVIIAGVIGFVAELVFRIFFNTSWRLGGGGRSSSSSDSDRKGGGAFAHRPSGHRADRPRMGPVAGGALCAVTLAEFLADAGSVELTKDPDAMISALRKIEGRGELPGATSAVMEMCIDNPRQGFADLFATHPSVDSRIKALVQYAGGRDPGPLPLPDGNVTDETGTARLRLKEHRPKSRLSLPIRGRGAVPPSQPRRRRGGSRSLGPPLAFQRQQSRWLLSITTWSRIELSIVSAMFRRKAG